MLLSTDFALIMQCPICGKRILYRFYSVFWLRARGQCDVVCSCGAELGQITFSRDHIIYLDVKGSCCEELHEFMFSWQELQEQPIYSLACDVEDQHLALFGLKAPLLQALQEDSFFMANEDPGLKPYFKNPRLMGYFLKTFYGLLQQGRVHCARCGQTGIDLQIGHKSIQLYCGQCTHQGELKVEVLSDLKRLLHSKLVLIQDGEIQLVPSIEPHSDQKD